MKKQNRLLLEEITSLRYERKYAVYLKLKHFFGNGCVYKYNPNKFALISRIDRRCITQHVKFFLEKGWCRMHSGNLIFISQSNLVKNFNIKNFNKINIRFEKKTKINDIVIAIREAILKNKYNQRELVRQMSRDLYKSSGPYVKEKRSRAQAWFRKHPNVKPFQSSENAKDISSPINDKYLNISFSGIAKKINRSASTAQRCMKKLISMKRVKKQKRPNIMVRKVIKGLMATTKHIPYQELLNLNPGEFYYNCCIWKRPANYYVLKAI